ncbi:MAG: hypothetical protein JXA89_13050 [Anaerolineae bacterium]|nr:hypothetical protein [Anaerolineae bacterium]
MPRQTDLEQRIRGVYNLILDRERILQVSDRLGEHPRSGRESAYQEAVVSNLAASGV